MCLNTLRVAGPFRALRGRRDIVKVQLVTEKFVKKSNRQLPHLCY
jgi:hypothetical protein